MQHVKGIVLPHRADDRLSGLGGCNDWRTHDTERATFVAGRSGFRTTVKKSAEVLFSAHDQLHGLSLHGDLKMRWHLRV